MPKLCRQYEYCLKNSARDFTVCLTASFCIQANCVLILCLCASVTMNLIAGQDRIFQLVENENDSPRVPRRDDENEHQEGRKEHTEKHVRKVLDIRKRTRTRQENQAERMLKRRRYELQPGEVGDSVTIVHHPPPPHPHPAPCTPTSHPPLTGDAEMQEQYWCRHRERERQN